MNIAMNTVWSYGGGKQSVAIAALIVQGKLPKPDIIVMADTGRERSSTWRYLNEWVQPVLAQHEMRIQIAPHSLSTVDLWHEKNDDGDSKPMLLIPAFTTLTKSNSVAKLPTYCSNEWKRRVVMRWLKAQGVERAEMWLGISRDEAHRMKDSDAKWLTHRYPLIELMMSREDCVRITREMGWPDAPKSTCKICPHLSNSTWLEMQTDDPEDFYEAVRIEREIQKRDPNIFLHRSAKPLDEIDFRFGLAEVFDGCDSGMCWT